MTIFDLSKRETNPPAENSNQMFKQRYSGSYTRPNRKQFWAAEVTQWTKSGRPKLSFVDIQEDTEGKFFSLAPDTFYAYLIDGERYYCRLNDGKVEIFDRWGLNAYKAYEAQSKTLSARRALTPGNTPRRGMPMSLLSSRAAYDEDMGNC